MNAIDKVNCLNKKCTLLNDDERMVTCWLCHGLCHFKCSGLSGLVADALRNNNGLHWCCLDCRKIGVEFYRFFQSTKSTFANIQNKMAHLSKEIAAYGNLFNDFNSLNSLNSPPQSSPKRRKSARIKNKDNSTQSPVSSNAVDPFVNVPVNTANSSLYSSVVSSNPSCVTNNPQFSTLPASSIAVDSVGNVPVNTSNSTLYSSVAVSNPTFGANNPQFPTLTLPSYNTPTIFSNNSSTLPSSNMSTLSTAIYNNNSFIQPNSELALPKQLKAIPKNQHIFLSRFASDTTIEDVNFYIKSNLNCDINISIHKFSYSQPRSITSFKLTTSPELFQQLVKPEFWPHNTLVREYVFKPSPGISNNIARLPRQDTVSKN